VAAGGSKDRSSPGGAPLVDTGKYVRYTPEQVEALERVYSECPKPSSLRRQQLIRECPILSNIEPKQIKVWFQNRRCVGPDCLNLPSLLYPLVKQWRCVYPVFLTYIALRFVRKNPTLSIMFAAACPRQRRPAADATVARNPAREPPSTSWPSGGAKWRQDLWGKVEQRGRWCMACRRATLDHGEHGCDPGSWRRPRTPVARVGPRRDAATSRCRTVLPGKHGGRRARPAGAR
jgi:hypothetical protein